MGSHRRLTLAALFIASLALGAQDPEYFQEKPADPYAPTGTLDLAQDKIRNLAGRPDIDRVRTRLRLRWKLNEIISQPLDRSLAHAPDFADSVARTADRDPMLVVRVDGIEIEVRRGFDAEMLRDVVAALREEPA